jgi:hypothetical protein
MLLRIWAIALCAIAPLTSRGEPISLHCARGVPDYPRAEMTLSTQSSHVVDVTFVGYRPSRVRAEWSLRDCLNTAMKLDGSRPIVGSLWYRDGAAHSVQELLLRLEKRP